MPLPLDVDQGVEASDRSSGTNDFVIRARRGRYDRHHDRNDPGDIRVVQKACDKREAGQSPTATDLSRIRTEFIGETGLEHGEKIIPADILQYHLFKNIMRDIDDALRYRANSLNFNEVHEIKTILIEIDGIVSALDFGTGEWQKTPDKEFYDTHFFGKFRKLQWLDLPQ